MLTSARVVESGRVGLVDGAGKVSSRTYLGSFFDTLDQVDKIDSTPIFKNPKPTDQKEVDYKSSQKFQARVVEAGRLSKQVGASIFVGVDPTIARFHAVARTGKAIEMLLSTPEEANPRVWAERIMWTEAARSVRERKYLNASILTAHAKDVLSKNVRDEFGLLSIAAGWGRLPLDVISEVDHYIFGRVGGIFIDFSEEAVTASQTEVKRRGLNDRVQVFKGDFSETEQLVGQFGLKGRILLGEATGLLDYLGNTRTRNVLEILRNCVCKEGLIVATNIISDRERDYLDIVWGRMHRRSPKQLCVLAEESGLNVKALVLDSTETMCTLVASPQKK